MRYYDCCIMIIAITTIIIIIMMIYYYYYYYYYGTIILRDPAEEGHSSPSTHLYICSAPGCTGPGLLDCLVQLLQPTSSCHRR